MAATQGQAERVAMLFGAAEASDPAILEQVTVLRAMRDPGLGLEHDRWVARVRAELSEADFAAA